MSRLDDLRRLREAKFRDLEHKLAKSAGRETKPPAEAVTKPKGGLSNHRQQTHDSRRTHAPLSRSPQRRPPIAPAARAGIRHG